MLSYYLQQLFIIKKMGVELFKFLGLGGDFGIWPEMALKSIFSVLVVQVIVFEAKVS